MEHALFYISKYKTEPRPKECPFGASEKVEMDVPDYFVFENGD